MGNILVPFKKFLSNKNTITILGVLIGLVVLYLGYNWRVQQSVQPTDIPICTSTKIANSKITIDDISYISVPKDSVSGMTNLLTNVNEITGKLVAFDSKIAKNGFFFSELLMTEDQKPNSIFSNIQDGYTVYALEVDSKKTLANSIMPGTEIDLYLYSQSEEDDGKLIYARFIKTIQVLAVRDNKGNNVFADKDNPLESKFLLFAVPEDLFLLLKKCEKLGIEIEPIGRNESYTENAGATSITYEELRDFVMNQTFIISNECTDLTIC